MLRGCSHGASLRLLIRLWRRYANPGLAGLSANRPAPASPPAHKAARPRRFFPASPTTARCAIAVNQSDSTRPSVHQAAPSLSPASDHPSHPLPSNETPGLEPGQAVKPIPPLRARLLARALLCELGGPPAPRVSRRIHQQSCYTPTASPGSPAGRSANPQLIGNEETHGYGYPRAGHSRTHYANGLGLRSAPRS